VWISGMFVPVANKEPLDSESHLETNKTYEDYLG
jgi:hypothetical protein